MSKDWVKDVAQFQKLIGHNPACDVERRIEYLKEEVKEFEESWHKQDVIEMADALGDLIYYAIGIALVYRIDLRPVMDEIHKSNMTKTPDPSDCKNCIKGPSFKKPNIALALHEGDLTDV